MFFFGSTEPGQISRIVGPEDFLPLPTILPPYHSSAPSVLPGFDDPVVNDIVDNCTILRHYCQQQPLPLLHPLLIQTPKPLRQRIEHLRPLPQRPLLAQGDRKNPLLLFTFQRIFIVGGVVGSAIRIYVDGIGRETGYKWARVGRRGVDFERAPVSLVKEIFVDCLQEVEKVGGGMVGGGWGGHE